jgi:hypothetical protein
MFELCSFDDCASDRMSDGLCRSNESTYPLYWCVAYLWTVNCCCW